MLKLPSVVSVLLAMLLTCAALLAPKQADAAIVASASAQGSYTSMTFTASMSVDQDVVSRGGKLWMIIFHNGYFYVYSEQTGFSVYQGGEAVAVRTARSTQETFQLQNWNVTSLPGAEIYLGFGYDMYDMLANGRFALVYRLPVTFTTVSPTLNIYGGPGNATFLGCFSCSEFASNSVWNNYSNYGIMNSYGIWSRYGNYASPYSTYSACNSYTTSAPVIVDTTGRFYGRFGVNQYDSNSVCSVTSGTASLCNTIRYACAN